MTTPCGLTRQELAAHNWLDNGMCNALFRNNNGDLQAGCGEPYASHPSSAQAQAGGGGQGQEEIDNEISRFWKALVEGGVTKNGREWTLSGEVPWIGRVKTFYNRECYDTIQNNIANMSAVLVKGTPGIGKTMFLQRVLVDIVEAARAAGKALPTIDYVRYEINIAVQYRLHSDGTVSFGNRNSVDYCLSDSVDLETLFGTTLTLLVASVKESNYNTFSKRVAEASRKGIVLHMDLCTLDELMVMNNVNKEEAQFRYAIFGGSARNFENFWTGDHLSNALVSGAMAWFFDSEKKYFANAYNSAISIITEQLNKSGLEDHNVVNSLMIHQQDGEALWASKFMEILGSIILDKKETTMYNAIKNLIGNSGFGQVFENIAHMKLTSSKASYSVKPLHKKGARNVSSDPIQFQFPSTVVRLRSVDDVHNLRNDTYGLPVTSNFPLVDAIVQPNILLQMTVSEERHKGAVDQLPHLREQLSEQDQTKHRMIFVVPQKNLRKFKHQENLSNIPQFIMCPDEVVCAERSKGGKRKLSELNAK